MNKFIMVVGLPGSGKDTWINSFISNTKEKYKVYSSDNIRKELYGDAGAQGNPNEVFDLMHKRVKQSLVKQENIIYNATNITSKNRMKIMNIVNNYKDYMKYAIIIGTTYEQCLFNNKKRFDEGGRFVPEQVIQKMYYSYEPPHYFEGFNKIEVIYPFIKPYKNYEDDIKDFRKISHDNPHHSLSIGAHMKKATKICKDDIKKGKFSLGLNENDQYTNYYNNALIEAIKFHDIGKPIVKDFHNSKGDAVEIAHYYNHENVGAYEYMFYVGPEGYNPMTFRFDCNIAAAIAYHMKPYNWAHGNTEKLEKRYKDKWGIRLYNLVQAVHKYDELGH